jgi:hypothetical protein
MFAPPRDTGDPFAPTAGVVGWQFPELFVTQDVVQSTSPSGHQAATKCDHGVSCIELYSPVASLLGMIVSGRMSSPFVLFEPVGTDILVILTGTRLYTSTMKTVVQHCGSTMWGPAEILIRCECRQSRLLSEAVETDSYHVAGALGLCDGGQPWLGPYANGRCEQPNRFLIRTASNAYFPQKLSVISLPPRNEKVAEAIEQAWMFLEAAESVDDVRHERKKERVATVLEGINDAEVWAEIERRRNRPTDSSQTS